MSNKENHHGPMASDTRCRYRASLHRVEQQEDGLTRLSLMLRATPERYRNVMRWKHRGAIGGAA